MSTTADIRHLKVKKMQVHTRRQILKSKTLSRINTTKHKYQTYESHGPEARNRNEVHKAYHTKQLLNTNTKRRHMTHSSRKKHIGIANWYMYLYNENHNTFTSTHTIRVGKVTHLVTPSYTTTSYMKVTSVHKYSDQPAVTT